MENAHIQNFLWHKRFEPLAWETISQATRGMRMIGGKTNKLKTIKFQINIHVKTHELGDFPAPHRNNRNAKTIEELTQSLKFCIRLMAGRKMQ